MGHTRKHSPTVAGTMSIPELRQAIHHITKFGAGVGKGTDAVRAFQREWQQTFGKPLPEKVARDYLAHVGAMKKGTRKQRGGMAPLAYRMEPGGTTPYGNFPAYVSKGFFVPMSDSAANCGKLDATVVPQAGLGSNEVGASKPSDAPFVGMSKPGLAALRGGGRRKTRGRGRKAKKQTRRRKTRRGGGLFDKISASLSAVGQRPFVNQNPTTLQHQWMMAAKGQDYVPGRFVHDNSYDTTWVQRRPDPSLPRLPVPMAPTITGPKIVQTPRL